MQTFMPKNQNVRKLSPKGIFPASTFNNSTSLVHKKKKEKKIKTFKTYTPLLDTPAYIIIYIIIR